MALCPFAIKKLIPAGPNDPKITARIGIWHVDAGNAESLYDYFRDRSGGIESHFFIKKSGILEQYRDTVYEADANYRANPFALSVETQGFGVGEWTDEQLDTSKRLMRWMNEVHDIPFQKTSTWDGRGFGYHVQFGSPGQWTPVAKSCPGADRIVQFNNILVPWLNKGGLPDRKPTVNITAALQADTIEERIAALQKVSQYGNDQASAAAKQWLVAIAAAKEARMAARAAREDLRDLEIKV